MLIFLVGFKFKFLFRLLFKFSFFNDFGIKSDTDLLFLLFVSLSSIFKVNLVP